MTFVLSILVRPFMLLGVGLLAWVISRGLYKVIPDGVVKEFLFRSR